MQKHSFLFYWGALVLLFVSTNGADTKPAEPIPAICSKIDVSGADVEPLKDFSKITYFLMSILYTLSLYR